PPSQRHCATRAAPHHPRIAVPSFTCSSTLPAVSPDLHSFPTRRSSDLLTFTWTPEEGVPEELLEPFEHGRFVLRGDVPAELKSEDRKSTRLNSSHSQISYAVFCLKKKKTTNE